MLWSSLCSVGRQGGGATSVEAASSCGARSASSRGPAGGENANPANWGSVEKYDDYRFLYEVIIVSLMRYLPRAPCARRQRLHPPAGRGVRPRHDPCSRDDEDLRQFPETLAGPRHEAALPQRGDDRNAAHNETRSCRPPRTLAAMESLSAAGPILKEGEMFETRAHSTMRVKELFREFENKFNSAVCERGCEPF